VVHLACVVATRLEHLDTLGATVACLAPKLLQLALDASSETYRWGRPGGRIEATVDRKSVLRTLRIFAELATVRESVLGAESLVRGGLAAMENWLAEGAVG